MPRARYNVFGNKSIVVSKKLVLGLPGEQLFQFTHHNGALSLHHLRRMHSSDFFTIYSRMKEKFRFSIELILIRFRGILGGDCNADLRKLGRGWALRVA